MSSSKPVIYQMLPRLWKNGKLSGIDGATIEYLLNLGVNRLWLTGIPSHASGKPFVKGDIGSPYAVSNWYDINHYLADCEEQRFEEFKCLVARLHKAGLRLFIDFVPNHVAPDYNENARACGEPEIPTCGWHDYDWTDTEKIDYNNPETGPAMLRILLFWAGLGVDGFRCDMVELVPPGFFRWAIAEVKKQYPDIEFIAEVYQKERYNYYINTVGFDFLYDKSGLYDTLKDIYNHGATARRITWNWQFLGDLQPHMLNFLENHDEVRVASREFASCPERAYAALAVSALFNTAPLMLYFGQEAGEDAEDSDNCRTSIFNKVTVKALQDGCKKRRDVFERYRQVLSLAALPAFSDGMVHDLCYCSPFDADKYFAWLRYDADSMYLVAVNFTDAAADVPVHIPDCVITGGRDIRLHVLPFDFSIDRIR